MMRTLLLTAFEPFDGESINPSWEVAMQLDNHIIADIKIVVRQLPVVFGESLRQLENAITQTQPDIVLCLGQAGGRTSITPERIAINLDDARISDNAGQQPCDKPIVTHAPVAYFSTLPNKAIVKALNEHGIPAGVSYSAGTFVCNHVFFGLQHMAAQYHIAQSGFVHIPYLPEQAARQKNSPPSMARETLLQGLRIIIQTCAQYEKDIVEMGGQTH